jgi:hypothetical protein
MGMANTLYASSTQVSNHAFVESGTTEAAGNTFLLGKAGSDYLTGVITTDATNITITWTSGGGTPSGNAYLIWEAYK